MAPGSDESPSNARSWRHVSRREALRDTVAAVGGAALVSPAGASKTTAVDHGGDAVVRVRVHPGAVPLQARLWYGSGLDAVRRDWPAPFRDALAAVEAAFEQVVAYAREQSRLESLEIAVERGRPIRFPPSTSLSPDAVLPSLEGLLERFRERLRAHDALAGDTSHVLLHWSPLNYRVGYGGTLSPRSLIGAGDDGDAQTVVNVGATERWDSRAVTRNMAIHETIHTFLSESVVEEVGGTRCEHDLGTAIRTDTNTLEISPIATAYASPDRIGAGTRFQGTGCYDHDLFSRHDGTDDVDTWTYTTTLSDATCEAIMRHLERRFEA
ncbi:hypothetical protein ACFR99_17955 [Haloarchaeobius amylolyticus]|uniref:Uncharacterized protein n=1 Tax=Haloarchaeobius amylolyticus TaxID=1198296 RepID=A0ABD6BJY2_9EURY